MPSESTGLKIRIKKPRAQPGIEIVPQTICPVCDLSISTSEIDAHYDEELAKFDTAPVMGTNRRGAAAVARKKVKDVTTTLAGTRRCAKADAKAEGLLTTVRRNRKRRKTEALTRARNAAKEYDEPDTAASTCPICSIPVFGSLEDVSAHVEICLETRREAERRERDRNGWGEEYSWAGQSRVRATALMEGSGHVQLASTGSASKASGDGDGEDDVEVDIDGDDEVVYGEAQYGEESLKVVNAVVETDALGVSEGQEPEVDVDVMETAWIEPPGWKDHSTSTTTPTNPTNLAATDLLLHSLRTRIHELESQSQHAYRCNICLGPYKTPVISVVCYHCFCEECWLQCLGSFQKLCPQCKSITTPKDLRRIYL
ncbi:hypothetical protein SAICODRAFT_6991 [Saitoella complicata NRRL Y-17804]|uniref:RING-type domain-containing protein n=1 Tax=Saitoella complicata (strain BCRC 22490 / CBS 7301 / JCM 7358 / NBRC 10748 / NRRL Y-17804) TaxID=698492 RepID=A0A0E9NM68_SAICN|nr:uncharacterized protein SAICODRAFT_6991 [Saitoella complicata NRRL Y-17804]ODQ53744.1 hypothetical protein SAICODRAFT_6991 [Saitoella complicata NRRL Y-17804]GAO50929.1 hypothetical protein G7K_5048-t1 [Saitoella complicata NRRL Y-17804]